LGIEDRVERVLTKLKLNKFYPFPFARSSFWQTVYGAHWPILKPTKPDNYHQVILPDNDIVVIAENRPPQWQPGQRIMLLVHGLSGNYQSTYMQRMCRRMNKKGYLVLRMNLRSCGPGRGLARHPYHCGVSEDTRQVLHWIQRRFPNSPVTQIGFSLGGNLTLKMAGEDGSRPSGNLDSVVAVSAPIDIERATQLVGHPQNKYLDRYSLKMLARDMTQLRHQRPDLPTVDFLDPHMTLRKFDEQFTVPVGGFKSLDDYYKTVSSINYIPEIKVPTLILSSMDDPIADGHSVLGLPTRSNLDVLLTEHGGHVGFLGFGTSYDEIRWSDQAVARWLEDTLAI
jgi:predicted alpha/beta-fold hydrolase